MMVFLQICGLALGVIILWRIERMNQKLQDAIDALNAEVADNTGKLASIVAFVKGVPALVGAAVADALAQNNVDEETAAASISDATQTMSDNVDAALSSIDANPNPGEEPLPTEPAAVEEQPAEAPSEAPAEAPAEPAAGEEEQPTE